MQDIGLALRSLRATPVVSFVAAVSLALGIVISRQSSVANRSRQSETCANGQ
jgi:hypothetical protein